MWESHVSPSDIVPPSYMSIEAKLPIAIVGLNIGAHQEAIEHFLHALTLRGPNREAPGGSDFNMELPLDNSADQIWQTLTRTATAMVGLDISLGRMLLTCQLLFTESPRSHGISPKGRHQCI